ncbi:hypothetical protein RSSM_00519 [Rhodopirellula sallentina SM41]|uniref:Uncharacterized protein n=1 Tax=Rhodopirellula sallentina SM41 TaxID=1263870 RepID=M5U993_9BACT|nr:hypothetical protein RSSM_00519 [Rhodopirellula sallentina SM41]
MDSLPRPLRVTPSAKNASKNVGNIIRYLSPPVVSRSPRQTPIGR